MRTAARWWPLTGLAFVGLWIGAFIATGNDVDTGDSDSKILAYYAKSSHQDRHIATFFMILAASLLFVWFLGKLREGLVRAEGGAGTLAALAYGAGIAAATLWIVSASFFTAAAFAVDDTRKFHLDPNTYRILSDMGYSVWFSGTTVASITVVATALTALRTGLLPKWIAWLSFPVALTMLVAFFFIPFLIMLGWILVVSLTLIVPKEAPAPTV
jgi:hypothetical protein